jgi:1,4-dihydroxy-2-naphthoate polyprenyltransferase
MTHWIKASRLRTLPLSLSGIFMGSIFSFSTSSFDVGLFFLTLFTAALLQILSNFANDYGDGIRGTDKNKKGEQRTIASGRISPKKMKSAIVFLVFLTLISGICLLWLAFGKENIVYLIGFLCIGGGAVLSAIYYTMGKNPYGYKGWGDFFVFIFFGWVAVLGSYVLQTNAIDFLLFLPASAIGLLSTSVLNLNNLRDYETDLVANKRTMVSILSIPKAKIYHLFLVISPFMFMIFYCIFSHQTKPSNFLFLFLFIPAFFHLKKVWTIVDLALLDSELSKIGKLTFLFAISSALPLIF